MQGTTIRKNKQSVRTAEGSSSHLNRTESSHSNNVGSASKSEPGQLQTIYATAWKIKKDII